MPRSGASTAARRRCCSTSADGRVMTVALRMTGALIVAAPGTPADPYARVVFALADGRELRYRDVRKFGRIGLWPGGGLRSVGAGRGARSRSVSPRVAVATASARSSAAMVRSRWRARFTAARLAERLSRRLGEAQDAAPRPDLHRRGREHLRRRGTVAARLHPLRAGGHARRRRRCAACTGPYVRSCGRGSRTAARASATTSAPTASRATTRSGWWSTGAPTSPATAAVGRSAASSSASAARTSARTVSGSR